MFASARACLLAVTLCAAGLGPAQATEDLVTVKVNMARILRLDAPAATVVIGNPGVADVTIQDPQTLILTGRSFGQTNMIILDVNGEPIADTILSVVETTADLTTVYQGTARTSLVCDPVCQPVIMVGDDPAYTSQVISSSSIVQNAAR